MYLNSDMFKLSGDFHFNNYGLQMDTMLQVQKQMELWLWFFELAQCV